MSFFSKYPLIEYIFTEKSGVAKKKLATNILRRAGFAEGSKLDNSFFVRYDIQDGDRPDIIADKIYNDSEYSWVVLLFNNIVNPYEEWPKDSFTLERDIEKNMRVIVYSYLDRLVSICQHQVFSKIKS